MYEHQITLSTKNEDFASEVEKLISIKFELYDRYKTKDGILLLIKFNSKEQAMEFDKKIKENFPFLFE